MYSTPMDTIQVEFDEHNKPDDHLVRYATETFCSILLSLSPLYDMRA